MKELINPSRRLLNRLQRRFVRSRPGSVLIMVVALLVLMALIGTAYITMAQSDRYAAQQHSYNTQIDLLVESVVNLAKGVFTRDLFDGNGNFRPAATFNNATGVGMDDTAATNLAPSIGYKPNTGSWWLADRLPVIDPTRPLGVSGNNVVNSNLPHWRFITGPLTGSTFESPQWPTSFPRIFSRDLPTQGVSGAGTNARWVPTFVPINGVNYPALTMVDANGNVLAPGLTYLAADADGDGIADSALFKLPVGTINGLTYYAGVRIVDNSAAVNVNTAWGPDDPQNPTLASLNNTNLFAPNNFFPSNINLFSLLATTPGNPQQTDSLDANGGWNYYRFGNTARPVLNMTPDENGNARLDFVFSSSPEAAWVQMGRRLQNPAQLTPGNPNNAVKYGVAGLTESMALAQRFILQNPTRIPSIVEQKLPISTQNLAPFEPYAPGATAAWFQQNFLFRFPTSANATLTNATPALPIRSVLTARNPQSSFVPSKFNFRKYVVPSLGGTLPVTNPPTPLYQFGDMVTPPPSVTPWNGRAYVYIGPTVYNAVVGVPQLQIGNQWWSKLAWAAEPYLSAPTKISVNSGTFEQLFTAFWSAMSQPITTALPYGVPPNTERTQFYSPLRDPSEVMPSGISAVTPPYARRFRPVNQRASLPPSEVVKLRAALAAVNTLNLRSGFSVNSRRILLNARISASLAPNLQPPTTTFPTPDIRPDFVNTVVEATIYGASPQPFITRVYADNDTQSSGSSGPMGSSGQNSHGYVGIELYNPYPFAIDIGNWQLGIMQGRSITGTPMYPNMKLMGVTGFNGFVSGTAPGKTTVIPGNGHLVIDNAPEQGQAGGPNDAIYRPGLIDWVNPQNPPPLPLTPSAHYFVSNLSDVLGGSSSASPNGSELVLLRPRNALLTPSPAVGPAQQTWPGGNGTGGTVSYQTSSYANEYAESPSTLYDYVPVDSFDFYGLSLGTASDTQFKGIYYARRQDATKWRSAYPGHWDPTPTHPWGTTTAYRQEGTMEGSWATNQRMTIAWSPTFPASSAILPFGSQLTAMSTDPCTFPTTNLFPPIQLNNWTFPGPYPTSTGGANRFPYGAFARNADILQVPYVGAYRLRVINSASLLGPTMLYTYGPDVLVELNPTTMDLQQADDYDTYLPTNPPPPIPPDDQAENIGRFTPISNADVPPRCPVNDFLPVPSGAVYNLNWRYHWAMQVLDYLTVESPQDAQLPAVAPEQYPPSGPLLSTIGPPQGINHTSSSQLAPQSFGVIDLPPAGSPASLTVTVRADLSRAPTSSYNQALVLFLTGAAQGQYFKVQSYQALAGQPYGWKMILGAMASNYSVTALPARFDRFVVLQPPEETAGTDGLINVNTASWRVLAAVPFVANSSSTTSNSGQANANIAWAIVKYRDVDDQSGASPPHGHGPFQSLFELNPVPVTLPSGQVVAFRDIVGGTPRSSQTGDFTVADGDLSPPTGLDGITGDFEGTFLAMNRVSNLLTTHSDSFTVYVVVQGWRDAETANPTLAVQRRAAFLVDRSVVTPLNPSPSFTPVPTD